MPATSEKQRRLMGMALAAKRGQQKAKSAKVNKLMRSMTLTQLEDFASKPKYRRGQK
jgi:hypothetical protein